MSGAPPCLHYTEFLNIVSTESPCLLRMKRMFFCSWSTVPRESSISFWGESCDSCGLVRCASWHKEWCVARTQKGRKFDEQMSKHFFVQANVLWITSAKYVKADVFLSMLQRNVAGCSGMSPSFHELYCCIYLLQGHMSSSEILSSSSTSSAILPVGAWFEVPSCASNCAPGLEAGGLFRSVASQTNT